MTGHPTRRLALGGVLLVLIGAWVSHAAEYARTAAPGWGAPGAPASVHLYMLPLAAVLGAAATLGAARLWRAWIALSWRLARARAGIEAAWRGRGLAGSRPTPDHPPSFGCRLVALWLPLAAAQIALYLVQENLEARWTGLPLPGLSPVTGLHWAAPLVHLAVALILAAGAAATLARLRRRARIVRLAERLLDSLLRTVARALTPARTGDWAPSPAELFGIRLLPRPPPASLLTRPLRRFLFAMKRGLHMPSTAVRIGLGAIAGTALALTTVATVSAHEHRSVAGYSVLIGWKEEPTYTGVRNAVQMFLNDGAGKPVNDLGDTLKVWVMYKDHTSAPQSFVPGFDPDSGEGTPGEYDAPLIPMKAGTYVLHLRGTIRGAAVDEKFTSSGTTFDNVDDRNAIEFPGGAEKAAKEAAPMPPMKGAAFIAIPFALGLVGERVYRRLRRRPDA